MKKEEEKKDKKEKKEKKEVKEEKKETKKEVKEKTNREDSLENRCPSCTASIKFNAKLGKWKCDYCGSEFTLEEMQKHSDNASTEKSNAKKEVADDYDDYTTYTCQSCGAEIVSDEQTAATFCVYCGNTAILKSKLSGKFQPDKIIPFKTEKEQATKAFKGLSKGRPLMPRDFNSEKNIEKIKGVYIPFWLYDIDVSGDVNISGTQVTTWTSGNRQYTKTDTYKILRGGSMEFKKIPVDGSTRFDNDIMNTIEPFNYNELIDYNHAYLSGFFAEKYDTEGEEVFNESKNRSINSAKSTFLSDAPKYTTNVITSHTLEAKEKNKEYAMLPVWMVNVKYKGKTHIFAMNGQTGEFIGNIPISGTRTFVYTVIIFIISLIFTIIASYIFFKIGE